MKRQSCTFMKAADFKEGKLTCVPSGPLSIILKIYNIISECTRKDLYEIFNSISNWL